MITYVNGNLLQSPAKVLVNPVNTAGVMGRGLALEFKHIYPEMFREYQQVCERGQLDIGKLHLYKTPHKWILNFPTKKHWRQPSRVEYIEKGLRAFRRRSVEKGVMSAAFPPLGCGNGQLDFETQVKPLMERYLGSLPISVFVYSAKPRVGAPNRPDIENIAEWLQGEPASLPFEEVWRDLLQVLEMRSEFETPDDERRAYRIYASEDPPSLTIESEATLHRIEQEDLLEFWQQLCDYGFTYGAIAPEHHRVAYLIPVFERLTYVQRVELAESFNGFEENTAVALQVVPPLRQTERALGDLSTSRVHDEEAGR